jgi:hypothetical protein
MSLSTGKREEEPITERWTLVVSYCTNKTGRSQNLRKLYALSVKEGADTFIDLHNRNNFQAAKG